MELFVGTPEAKVKRLFLAVSLPLQRLHSPGRLRCHSDAICTGSLFLRPPSSLLFDKRSSPPFRMREGRGGGGRGTWRDFGRSAADKAVSSGELAIHFSPGVSWVAALLPCREVAGWHHCPPGAGRRSVLCLRGEPRPRGWCRGVERWPIAGR